MRGLFSYKNLAQSRRYEHGANVFIRGELKYFDLQMVAAAVAEPACDIAFARGGVK